MCTVKTHKHRFPFVSKSANVPNDTGIYGILKVPRTISFNCCTCNCMFQQYRTRMNKEKFQTAHRNKNKLRLKQSKNVER